MSALAAALGNDAMARLSFILGGRRLFVPRLSPHGRSPAAQSRLVAIVGTSLAEDLITYFGGTYVYVPKSGPPCPKRSIDRRTVKRLSKRMSANEIAIALSCSVRTVYKVRATSRRSGLTTSPTHRKQEKSR